MEIRPFHSDDGIHLCNWFTNETELIQWGGPVLHYPLCTRQIQQMQSETQDYKPQRLMFSGYIQNNLTAHAQLIFDWDHGVARLGRVAINPAFRGQRLARPFLQKIIAIAFEKQEIVRLELNVFTFNQQAIQIYRKLDFRFEGIRRSCLQIGSERWDTAIFAILRSELEAISYRQALAS